MLYIQKTCESGTCILSATPWNPSIWNAMQDIWNHSIPEVRLSQLRCGRRRRRSRLCVALLISQHAGYLISFLIYIIGILAFIVEFTFWNYIGKFVWTILRILENFRKKIQIFLNQNSNMVYLNKPINILIVTISIPSFGNTAVTIYHVAPYPGYPFCVWIYLFIWKTAYEFWFSRHFRRVSTAIMMQYLT